MVVSVRAASFACFALLALTAAAPLETVDRAQFAETNAGAALASGADEAQPVFDTGTGSTYFVLQDRDEPAPTVAQPSATLAIDDADETRSSRASTLTAEERCLAVAVYYEARGEPIAGQFAVAHVVLNRARSGRFADTPCGVVRQPGQFAFAHRSFTPASNADWQRAVAVARGAIAGSGASQAHGALYFHASSVSPGWSHSEVAQIGRHVFYR